jgi:hypothetical protein
MRYNEMYSNNPQRSRFGYGEVLGSDHPAYNDGYICFMRHGRHRRGSLQDGLILHHK